MKIAFSRIALSLSLFAATPAFATESTFCAMPADPASSWLPVTPAPSDLIVPAPRPASDCQFYRAAWQRFLYSTQLVGGRPALLGYPSFERLFAGRDGKVATTPTAPLTLVDYAQATLGGGPGGNLIDQNGRFVFYAIHVNPAFQRFLFNQGLTDAKAIDAVDPALTVLGDDKDIDAGASTQIAEFKSAWMVVSSAKPPANYIVADARIPHLVVNGGALVQEIRNGAPVFDRVVVALLSIHVVFTLPGHPEMIWSTFEHVHLDESGKAARDNAPEASDNPSTRVSSDAPLSKENFPLYKAGTTINEANQPYEIADIVKYWNPTLQAFRRPDGTPVQTSVYRPYPGSKTDGSKANPGHGEDDEVAAMNQHATEMFEEARADGRLTAADRRDNYRLVGATWLNKPAGAEGSFRVDQFFRMAADQSTDDDDQAIAGEGRLASVAMESFTQTEEAAPACFSCHDTNAIAAPSHAMKPSRMNVSHVLAKFMNLPPAPQVAGQPGQAVAGVAKNPSPGSGANAVKVGADNGAQVASAEDRPMRRFVAPRRSALPRPGAASDRRRSVHAPLLVAANDVDEDVDFDRVSVDATFQRTSDEGGSGGARSGPSPGLAPGRAPARGPR